MIELDNPGPQISVEQIALTENALGVNFPADYQEFLLKSNGGTVCLSFDCADNERSSVGAFYRILSGHHDDIIEANKLRAGRLPRGFVAIADDYGGGDEICIDCTPGPRYGKVYFWDHEMEADLSQGIGPDEAGNIHLIANSFTEFLDCLYEKNMDHIEPTGELVPDPEARKALEDLMRRKGLL